mmetsp:Transcript_19354/g.17570  ORF Transcript_19354/g.17570 Transcript_19354/m.17570 type:complete len:205 (+) Transcript_19354:354-968(+)
MNEFVNSKEVVTNDTLLTLANRARELSDKTIELSTRLDDVKQIITSRCGASVWAGVNNSYLAIGILSVGLLLHFSILAPIIIPSAVFLAIGAIGASIGVGATLAGAYVGYKDLSKISVDASQLDNLNELVKSISDRFDAIRKNLDKAEIKCCQREDITSLRPLVREMEALSKKLLSDLQAVPRLKKYFRFYNILTVIEYLGSSK